MTSSRRADARNTYLVGLGFSLPATVGVIVTWMNGWTLFTVLLLPLVAYGALVCWLATFDWLVARGSEISQEVRA